MMKKDKLIKKRSSRQGYIAFVSFLIIAAVVAVVGITLSLLSISEAQMGLSERRGRYALYLVEGCMEDSLLSSYYSSAYNGGTRSYPEGSCTTTITKNGKDWILTASATNAGHTKSLEVKMNRDREIIIESWKEIE
jgi:hypothetical protein